MGGGPRETLWGVGHSGRDAGRPVEQHSGAQGAERTPPRWSPSSAILSSGWVLALAAVVVLLLELGAAQLWTQEGRWGDICRHMLESGDYTHPRLLGLPYYDKPLLSYWLMIGVARLTSGLSEWALRLPSALAALLTVGCVVRLGSRLWDRATGILAGWVLLSTVLFVFWGRVASADMLNVAAIVAAVTWYFERRDRPGPVSYLVFFGILGVGSLLKGLVAPAMACLLVAPDLLAGGRWRHHVRPSLLLAMALGAAVVLAPFLLSGVKGAEQGLYMLFRENLLRYFDAFDHRDPPVIYAEYLPLFLLPWTIFLPALVAWLWRSRGRLDDATRWATWAALVLLAFLTLSTSRRPYYMLPVQPIFALLFAAWLRSAPAPRARRRSAARALVVASCAGMAVWYGVVTPLSMRIGGLRIMRSEVHAAATRALPGSRRDLILLGAGPKASYYLKAPGRSAVRLHSADPEVVRTYLSEHPDAIVVSRRKYRHAVESVIGDSIRIDEHLRTPGWLPFAIPDGDLLEAYVPRPPDAAADHPRTARGADSSAT